MSFKSFLCFENSQAQGWFHLEVSWQVREEKQSTLKVQLWFLEEEFEYIIPFDREA